MIDEAAVKADVAEEMEPKVLKVATLKVAKAPAKKKAKAKKKAAAKPAPKAKAKAKPAKAKRPKPKAKKAQSARVLFIVDASATLKAKVRRAAQAKKLSMTKFIRALIEKHVK